MPAKNKANEIYISRIYDAPVKTVWEAWTDPAQVARWWGPRGFSLTTHSKNLKPGGTWDYTMHGPDGTDYPNKTKYLEVEKYKRLVYDHGSHDDRPPLFRVTVLFNEIKGKTQMEMTMALDTAEAAEQTKKFIKEVGGNSTWDRLAEYLEKNNSGKETFVINRTFNAPLEHVFEMWTNPEHFAKWMPPKGFSMEFIRADVKPGGGTFYRMFSDNQKVEMYGRSTYVEIKKPDYIIYNQQFCDENENISRHPMAPTWPETMHTVVTFAAEGPEQTRITVTWSLEDSVTQEELAAFIKERGGMTQGWTGSFDKLENYLLKQGKAA